MILGPVLQHAVYGNPHLFEAFVQALVVVGESLKLQRAQRCGLVILAGIPTMISARSSICSKKVCSPNL